MNANQIMERKIVRKLIRDLGKAGYKPIKVWDDCEYVDADTETKAIDAVFSVDISTLHFQDSSGHWGNLGVMLVCGNGMDIISDYHSHTGESPHADFSSIVDKVCDTIHME